MRYTENDFIQAVKNSTSIRQVLNKLNIKEAGGNYLTCKKRIKKLGLNTDHFSGKAWNRGKKIGPKRDIHVYLNNQYPIQSHKLKLRLIKEKIFEHKCYACGLTEWLNQPIPLELEHKNGKHQDNTLDNLTLLCPNCHAQTSTYRGRNVSKNLARD